MQEPPHQKQVVCDDVVWSFGDNLSTKNFDFENDLLFLSR